MPVGKKVFDKKSLNQKVEFNVSDSNSKVLALDTNIRLWCEYLP